MRRAIVCGLCCAGLVLSARPAQAERAAVLRLGGDPGIAERTRRDVVGKLTELLRGQGLEVMSPAETARRARSAECSGAECEARLRSTLGVDLLVTLGLWAAPDGSNLRAVVIGLVGDGTYFGNAEVAEAGVAAALVEALAKARARQALGPGPWLRVEGEPRGARVLVDGRQWGVLPNEAAVRAGEHRVVVRLDGYVAESRTVTLQPLATEPLVLTVRLVRAAPVRAPAKAPRAPPRPARVGPRGTVEIERPVLGPVVLGGLGVAGIGVALGALLAADCRVEDPDRCMQGTSTNEWALTYGVGGAVALGAALAWHVFGGKARRTGPTVGLGPGSIYVLGEL